MAPARREFDRLLISVAAAVLETLDAIAQNPKRLGKPLMLEHEGRYSARRGPYRIIYELTMSSIWCGWLRSGIAATCTDVANATIEARQLTRSVPARNRWAYEPLSRGQPAASKPNVGNDHHDGDGGNPDHFPTVTGIGSAGDLLRSAVITRLPH
jgi:mRNA interferase RelE/StbE